MVRQIQPSFAGGELAPALWARIDLQKYGVGARKLRNFLVHPHGGASNRPGTYFLAAAKHGAKKCRLIPFEFNTLQTYVLEFGDKYIRFYAEGGQVMKGTPAAPYEITTPYAEDDLFEINYTQSADVLYLTHPYYPPYKLSRKDHTDWTLAAMAFSGGPFFPENGTDVTIAPSAKTGTVTLTASSALFETSHVGSLWKLTHYVEESSVSGSFSANGNSATVPTKGSWQFVTHGTWTATLKIQRSFDNGTTWLDIRSFVGKDDRNLDVTGEEDEEDVIYRINCSGYSSGTATYEFHVREKIRDGVVKITDRASATSVTATVQRRLGGTAATKLWAEGAWSSRRGYPRTCMFFQERLVFAGSLDEPQTVWMSQTADYENFWTSREALDSDAITATIAARQVNAIRAVVPLGDLLVMTSGGEWKIAAGDQPVTPSSLTVTVQGYRGISTLKPIVAGNSVLFVQDKGNSVIDFGYSLEADGYDGKDRSILAAHLFGGHSLLDWDYQQIPWSIAWTVRDDGALLGFTYLKEHDVWAWHTHDTVHGAFESVCSVSASGRDDVYVVVRREIGGETVRFVEQLMPRITGPLEDMFYVDCGLSYDGAPADSLSGLDHLEGETVAILADGHVHPQRVVESGAIELEYEASVVHVGLPVTSDLETLNIELETRDGTAQGKKKRISSVVLRVEKSRGGWVGPDVSRLSELKPTHPSVWDDPIGLVTGDVKLVLRSGWDEGGRVWIRQSDPLPLTVLAVIPEVTYGG